MSFWCLQDQLTLFKPGGRLCPSHYCQLPWILEAIYTCLIKLGQSLKYVISVYLVDNNHYISMYVIYLKYVTRYCIDDKLKKNSNVFQHFFIDVKNFALNLKYLTLTIAQPNSALHRFCLPKVSVTFERLYVPIRRPI